MSIKKLFFETAVVLSLVTLLVVTINSFQVHQNASQDLRYLQKQYLNATFEIYKNEIIGDILVGNKLIIKSLLSEIANDRNVGAALSYDNNKLSVGEFNHQTSTQVYKLNLGNEKFASIVLYPLKNLKISNYIDTFLLPLVLEIFVLALGFLFLLGRIKKSLLNPLNEVALNLKLGNIEKFSLKIETVSELKQLCATLQKMTADLRKKARYEAEVIAAKQVAHDIRSPLACLNLLLSYAVALPEKQRIMMRSSIQRITDIANNFQSKAIIEKSSIELISEYENVMLSSLLELLITEKRIQIGLKSNVIIDLNLDKSYGLFSYINPAEFKRVLSNLIDNSLEAFDDKFHHICVTVFADEQSVCIHMEDNGKGIPLNVLPKVGAYGFSYGKDGVKSSGNGLGVYHALKTISSFGGSMTIDSKVNCGTTVVIKLPKVLPPKWFVSSIDLCEINLIIILDDDESIHNLWRDKLLKLKMKYHFEIKHFRFTKDFEAFNHNELLSSTENVLFLMDYEFVGQDMDGLSLVERLAIEKNSIMVTSHYDDFNFREKAISLGVKIIPKSAVSYISLL